MKLLVPDEQEINKSSGIDKVWKKRREKYFFTFSVYINGISVRYLTMSTMSIMSISVYCIVRFKLLDNVIRWE